MEQTLFEKFDKIVCPINIAKTPTDLENLSGLIICFLQIKSSKVIYDFSAKNITHCIAVLCSLKCLQRRIARYVFSFKPIKNLPTVTVGRFAFIPYEADVSRNFS